MEILVVEDDPDIRGVLEQNLREAGYVVLGASSAADALRVIGASIPDLVLLDLMLPDRPGTDVCRALRNDARTRTVPVIMLSALSGDDHRVAGLEVGADDYVQKPFSMRELLLRIGAVLRRSGADTQPPHIDSAWATAREQIRVWEGFSANHFQRGEWRECREISRTLLHRYGAQLTAQETALLIDRVRRCDDKAEPLRDSA